MKIKTFSYVVGALNIILLGTLVAILFLQFSLQKRGNEADKRLLVSHQLAEELRQSSDDLTRMARTYVNTGDPIFKEYYFAILGIRNGTVPRPSNYTTTYWSLASGRREGKSPIPTEGERIPLQELMRRTGFQEDEFALLGASQAESDSLVNTELRAFAAVEGFFEDRHGRFTVHRRPDRDYAQKLMYDDAYRTHKTRIMDPIDRFVRAVDERTSKEQADLSRRRSIWLQAALSVGMILLVGFLGSGVYIRRSVLLPLGKLERQVESISKGDHSARNDIHLRNEFNTLGEHFNAMTGRLDEWYEELEAEVRERTHQLGEAHTALSKSEELFRAAFDTATDGFVIVGRDDGRFVEVNHEFEVIYGYRRDEVVGKTSLELGMWAHPEVRQRMLDELVSNGRVRNLPVEAHRKGGETLHVLYSVTPLEVGGRSLLLGVIRDVTLQKKMEEELRSNEVRLQNLSDNVPGGFVYQLDMGERGEYRKFTYLSAGVEQLHEVTPNAVMQNAEVLYGQIVESDRSMIAELESQAWTNMSIFRTEARFRLPSGAVRWCLLTSAPRRTHNGHVIWDGIEVDITERKRAETELREGEERFRTLSDKSLVGVYLIQDGRLAYANDAIAKIFGGPPAELIGADPLSLIHPDDREYVSQKISERLAGVTPRDSYEARGVTKNGEIRFLELVGTRIDLNGRPAILGNIIDMTERRLAEERVKEREVQYRELVETARDAIYTVSVDGNFTSVNAAFVSATGWEREELIGTPFLNVVHANDVPRLKERFGYSIAGKAQPLDELRIKTKSGKYLLVELNTVPQMRKGEVVGVLGIGRDVSERKQLEEQLRRTQRLESIGSLASGIAHDLNNVLGPILLGTDVLIAKLTDESSKTVLNTMKTSSKRGRDIVKQVLAFARGTEQEYAPQQLRYLISEIHSFVMQTFPKNIDLNIDIPKDLPPVIGDSTQLHQVLLNLCVNARDAMPSGGHIDISALEVNLAESEVASHAGSSPGEYVCLSVADSGTGIPDEIMPKIFDPFFTTKEIGKGTGLGLATVSTIVREHKGFISLVSKVGHGTEFKIYLPAVKQKESAVEQKELPVLPRGNGEGILVVDDEKSVLQIARAILETYNYKVYTATDGVEATLMFGSEARGAIDLVVSDINMPRMGGLDMARILKSSEPSVRILITSGSPEEIEARGSELATYKFLAKPYTADQLLRSIDDLLHGPGQSPLPG